MQPFAHGTSDERLDSGISKKHGMFLESGDVYNCIDASVNLVRFTSFLLHGLDEELTKILFIVFQIESKQRGVYPRH